MQIMIDMKEAHQIARMNVVIMGGEYKSWLAVAMKELWKEVKALANKEAMDKALIKRENDMIKNPANYTVSEAFDELPLWKTKQIVMTYLKLVFEGENYTDNYIGVLSTNTINSGDVDTVCDALKNWGYR